MPIPAGQSCANCQFLGATGRLKGFCLYEAPSLLRNLDSDSLPPVPIPPWRRVTSDWWCGRWLASGTGTSGLLPLDAGIGYRGSDDTGTTVALTGAWTLLQPTWAAVTNAINFDVPTTGEIRLNYTTTTPSPTLEMYAQMNGIVTFTSASPNEQMEITFGVNGTAIDAYKVRLGITSSGVSAPIPIVAGLALKDQDTVGIFARSPTNTNATYRDYHLLAEAFKAITL